MRMMVSSLIAFRLSELSPYVFGRCRVSRPFFENLDVSATGLDVP